MCLNKYSPTKFFYQDMVPKKLQTLVSEPIIPRKTTKKAKQVIVWRMDSDKHLFGDCYVLTIRAVSESFLTSINIFVTF